MVNDAQCLPLRRLVGSRLIKSKRLDGSKATKSLVFTQKNQSNDSIFNNGVMPSSLQRYNRDRLELVDTYQISQENFQIPKRLDMRLVSESLRQCTREMLARLIEKYIANHSRMTLN